MNFSTLRDGNRTYFDHNATTPLSERVSTRVPDWLNHWGNPSSIHQTGRGPKQILRESREKIANLLGVGPLEIVFTSGGSEANNLALKGVYEMFQRPELFGRTYRNRYLISSVEHPSLKRSAEYLQSRGAEVVEIPVCRDGSIDLAAYSAQLSDQVALVSVMYANNETGNLFPIREMAEMAQAHGALFHSDCVQALGKIPLNLRDLGVDLASVSGHKFYSLKGSGLLYVRRGLQIESLIHGGAQERHRRGGTENLLAVAGLGTMAELANEIAPRADEMRVLRDHLEARVLREIEGVSLTGAESPRLPNTSSLVISGVDGESLLMNLDMRGFSVSTGAACSSGSPEPSQVLLAIGLSRAEAQSSLRLGLGWENTRDEVDRFVEALKEVVAHLRSIHAQTLTTSKTPREAHANS
jgi:cysteine desulfurase